MRIDRASVDEHEQRDDSEHDESGHDASYS